jgi:hypothetical protein
VNLLAVTDRFGGLAVTVPGYSSGGPSRPDLLRSGWSGTGSTRLVRIVEELLEYQVVATV